jgi:hypothetical protein
LLHPVSASRQKTAGVTKRPYLLHPHLFCLFVVISAHAEMTALVRVG